MLWKYLKIREVVFSEIYFKCREKERERENLNIQFVPFNIVDKRRINKNF